MRSLHDTDFYKVPRFQLIWRRHRDTEPTFALINRTRSGRLADVIDESELRAQFDHARAAASRERADLAYMQTMIAAG